MRSGLVNKIESVKRFFLTDYYGAPVFKILIFWAVGIMVIGVIYQNRMQSGLALLAEREKVIKTKETRLADKEEELEKTSDELARWNQAISLKAKEMDMDKKLKVMRKELEDDLYPPAE